ncbi:ABC transporter ATP-binding protein [Spiroplasma chinense]|uniref:ABC transporter ATP-binding protein n=1 Tax=Spiroplasma chinense TaxID=216932 RepID=A0A5B9Y5E4_9MOLU|nr:ATP-binding cassette domain-containing protein [Spiroplasma chinense]QEH61252.1 ABC transporter ATP-binding protein [Spiroplasma chinense]
MLEIKNLSKSFKDFSLEKINLKINKGDFIAFIGENGSGKTTIIKLIFNLLKKDNGEIIINNENLFLENKLKEICLFPNQGEIPYNLTVKDYLWYVSVLANVNRESYNNRIIKILEIIKIVELQKRKIKTLSTGQIKKVMLAGVLIVEPSFIFMDEPTANLDIDSKEELLEIINFLSNREVGIFITSHITDELDKYVNRLIVLKNGQIVYDEKYIKGSGKILEIYNRFYIKKENVTKQLGDLYEK